MAIPESQLKTWSNQGATDGSARTYASIKNALAQHSWPSGMDCDVYLQGSYSNYTNIRGNSDVDVVIESSNVFSSNLSESEKRQLDIVKGDYGFWDFRNEVVKALTTYYGSRVDAYGQKSVKIASTSNLLAADVVPCITYRQYYQLEIIAQGITFWTQSSGQQIINYPRVHQRNGSNKNSRTNHNYKPSVRMFKNVRERILADNPSLQGSYPSYFVECLLYNVPDECFVNWYSNTFYNVVYFLLSENSGLAQFRCQNEQLLLFGNLSTQWDTTKAVDFVNRLCVLWEQW